MALQPMGSGLITHRAHHQPFTLQHINFKSVVRVLKQINRIYANQFILSLDGRIYTRR